MNVNKAVDSEISIAWDIMVCTLEASDCPDGFMGPSCRFRCNKICDNDAAVCNRGYFGPLCQYVFYMWRNLLLNFFIYYYYFVLVYWPWEAVDIVSHKPNSVLTDDNALTCLNGTAMNEAYFTFPIYRVFTFLELVSENTSALMSISVSFKARNVSQSCSAERRDYNTDRNKVDIYCTNIGLVTEIKLGGAGLPWLCEIHISGGRNVALKAPYVFSSKLNNSINTEAITDGIHPRGEPYSISECHHSISTDSAPWVVITLPFLTLVSHIIVYNRLGFDNRIQGMNLTLSDAYGRSVFTYIERRNKTGPLVHIPHTNISTPIKQIRMMISGQERNIINICEVEVYGECSLKVTKASYVTAALNASAALYVTAALYSSDALYVNAALYVTAAIYSSAALHANCESKLKNLSCGQSCHATCLDGLCNLEGRCLSCPKGKYGIVQCPDKKGLKADMADKKVKETDMADKKGLEMDMADKKGLEMDMADKIRQGDGHGRQNKTRRRTWQTK
ncbi:hypothetical protein Btru_013606 [Bulinus truncatus]|nr:hypothetical protein Btru_013606 [Bulinus truncatus]